MQLTLKLLAGAAAASLSVGAAAQMGRMGSQMQQPPSGANQSLQRAVDQAEQNAQNNAQPQTEQVKRATAAEIKAGAEVYDPKGGEVGKIESVATDGVVVSTGTVRAKIPASSLGHGDKGLVIALTKSEFEAAAKKGRKPTAS
jgi:hypothetical protein